MADLMRSVYRKYTKNEKNVDELPSLGEMPVFTKK
jgi:hypothetical protein